MLKLRRLRVEKLRSLTGSAELVFSDGINVLLGYNGTGKTTLLQLISMIVRSDFRALAKEEFAVEYELALSDHDRLLVRIRNDRAVMDPAQTPIALGGRELFYASVELHDGATGDRLLRYRPGIGLVVDGRGSEAMSAEVPLSQGFLIFYLARVPQLFERYYRDLLAMTAAWRFDESLELLQSITGPDAVAGEAYVRDALWQPTLTGTALVPAEILGALRRSYRPPQLDYSFPHSELSFLATTTEMLGFAASEVLMDLAEDREQQIVEIRNLTFRFRWADGSPITQTALSYGQKRLLMFFYYLACNATTVIADELVNGLHHRWITSSIEAIGERQAFLTSQNPILLDYVPVPSAIAAQQSFVLCRGEPRDGKPGWIWENMQADDATALFEAYEVGIEHVSEILQSRGLW